MSDGSLPQFKSRRGADVPAPPPPAPSVPLVGSAEVAKGFGGSDDAVRSAWHYGFRWGVVAVGGGLALAAIVIRVLA